MEQSFGAAKLFQYIGAVVKNAREMRRTSHEKARPETVLFVEQQDRFDHFD